MPTTANLHYTDCSVLIMLTPNNLLFTKKFNLKTTHLPVSVEVVDYLTVVLNIQKYILSHCAEG